MKQAMLLCVSLLLCLTFAHASGIDHSKGWGAMDGNDLLPMCQAGVELEDGKNLSSGRMVDAMHCLTYLQGFLDGFFVRENAPGAAEVLCFPEGVNAGQMVRVVAKWLQDHPEKLHEPAYSCVFAAIHGAFACHSAPGQQGGR